MKIILNTPIVLAVAVLIATSTLALADSPALIDRSAALTEARAGHWEQAEPALASLAAADPADVEACVCLAQRRMQQRRNKEAVALMQRAVAVQPDRAELQSQLGMALSQRIGEVSFFHQAFLAGPLREAFEKSVALDPNHLPGLIGLSRYYMGAPAIAGGSIDKAEEYAARVEKLDPFNGALSFGMIREHTKNWAEAEAFYLKALTLQSQHAWLHAMLGNVYVCDGKSDAARTEFEAALTIQPNNEEARSGLAGLAGPAKK